MEANMETKKVSKRAQLLADPVRVVARTNPKKNPSMSYTRFQAYYAAEAKHGDKLTVELCLKAGVRGDDIRHDMAHGFIVVGKDAIAAADKLAKELAEKRLAEARALVAAADKK
jgi:hypothetical protein